MIAMCVDTLFGWIRKLLISLMLIGSCSAGSALPEGLFLIGFTDSGWQFFRMINAELEVIDKVEHPRGGTYHPGLDRIAYIGSDHQFKQVDLATGTEQSLSLSDSDNSRYAQPRYSQDGRWLLAVQLPDGRSRQTNIIGIDTSTGTRYQFVRKRTAQFEPQLMSSDHLYYTTAICVDDCEGMIWELWHRDMLTAQQKQLTLMNAVARQPHLGYDGQLYFSSNAGSGHYHIWRMQPEVGAAPVQLTFGAQRDSNPATDREGNLYFLRKSRGASKLMRLSSGKLSELALPAEIQDVRYLEVVQ